MNGLRGVLRLKEEKLSNNNMGSIIRDGAIDTDDSLLEEAREDVVGSLSSRRVLYHHRDQAVRPRGVCQWGREEGGFRQRSQSSRKGHQAPRPQHGCGGERERESEVENGSGRPVGGGYRREIGRAHV